MIALSDSPTDFIIAIQDDVSMIRAPPVKTPNWKFEIKRFICIYYKRLSFQGGKDEIL